MWLDECINDLYEAGLDNPNLAVIYEANKVNKVAVMTPNGLTNREDISKIVMQGEVFGPIECSVTVDTFGKECLSEQKYLYSYKGLVGVPPLAMVDDLACISVCGVETVLMNGFINAKTNIKKLQFGETKCHRMHIGKENSYCPDLYIDNWKVKEKTEFEAKVDTFNGDHKIEESEEEKYLGDLVASDGSNSKNIKARKGRGFGIINQIASMLDEICFGPHYFEVAMTLRSSLFISSILLNSEIWYGLKKTEVQELEYVDQALLRRILEAPACTPTPMLYLELGCIPIRYLIKSRRMMFLQYLLKQEEDSLLYKFFLAQVENPVKGDWTEQAIEDLNELDIGEIKLMSTRHFKLLSKQLLKKLLFLTLLKKKKSYPK